MTTADLADIAAWFTFDAGQPEPARGLSLLSLQAARESGALGMRANVASGLARQEIRQGNWAAGLDLTQLALTAGDALPGRSAQQDWHMTSGHSGEHCPPATVATKLSTCIIASPSYSPR